jgi:serine/threonine protein kinase
MSEDLLKGRYRHLSELGRGEYTVSYKAQDTLLDRTVVVKTLRDPYTADLDWVEYFHRAARAMAALTHPHIVAIYDMGSDRDLHYVVTEYVEGHSLESILAQEPLLDQSEAVNIALAVCQALAVAHSSGYVHGHLSPRDILLGQAGQVKVSDFQVVEIPVMHLPEERARSPYSALYLSPEQLMGRRTSATSDVYSMGVILYEMLTGRPPFIGERFDELAEQHIRHEPVPVHQVNPEVSSSLSGLIQTALAKGSGDRYRRADELAVALQDYLSRSGLQEFLRRPAPEVTVEPVIEEEQRPSPPVSQALPQGDYESGQTEARSGLDLPGCMIGIMATVAVLGLIPLWLAVYLRYFA